MTTLRHSRTAAPATPHRYRAGFALLIAGGAAFFVSGPLHPTGSDAGDKTEQLHSDLTPQVSRVGGERQNLGAGVFEMRGDLGKLVG